jgi:hypothetical protein
VGRLHGGVQSAPTFTNVIDKVEAPDAQTVKITLKEVSAPFLTTHASSAEGPWFILVETIDSGQVQRDPVGTGAWLFRQWDKGVAIRWDRNLKWFDAPASYFAKTEQSLNNDPQRILAALQVGELDISGLNGPTYEEAKKRLDSKGQDTSYIIRRLLLMIPTLIGISPLITALLRLLPGDAVDILVTENAVGGGSQAFKEIVDGRLVAAGIDSIQAGFRDRIAIENHLIAGQLRREGIDFATATDAQKQVARNTISFDSYKDKIRAEMGLDKNYIEQWWIWAPPTSG